MRDVFATAAQWLHEGRSFALATLVGVREAATAPVGTTIAVTEDGEIVGNIGAGCHESEIVEACQRTLRDGTHRLLDIDLDDDDELTGGSACGAMLEVVAWRPAPAFRETALAIASGERDVRFILPYRRGDRDLAFEHVFEARERLIVVGATALAAALVTLARPLGFRTVVVDPRPAFATSARVENADEIVREWPDEYLPRTLDARCAVVMLSHDPKFDVPSLRCALESRAWFVGLLGSRRSQAARRDALRALGVEEDALARIHGPVGLDIGGTTPAETALSILAEIVAARHGRSGEPLHAIATPIHAAIS